MLRKEKREIKKESKKEKNLEKDLDKAREQLPGKNGILIMQTIQKNGDERVNQPWSFHANHDPFNPTDPFP